MGWGKLFLKVADMAMDYISNEKEVPVARKGPSVRDASCGPRPVEPEVVREKSLAEWKDFFREILQSEFPSYTIREEVPVTDLAGFATDEFKLYKRRPLQAYKAEWGQPYTFVLEDGGKATAIVMLGKGHSHDSNVKYLIARMYAKKLDLPYINFYTQMPNERSYVVQRIRRFIN